MDGLRFDELTRALGAARTRRSVLGALAGAAIAAFGFDSADAASRKRTVGNVCAANGDCASGVCAADSRAGRVCHCRSGGDCPASTGQCHVAVCLPSGLCGVTVTAGASCDDGNACTTNDSCQADGTCAGAPISCPTPDQCHLPGSCNPRTGICSNPSKPNGSACDDGDACTQTDTCQAGVCIGGNPVVCQPLDQCHLAGACNPATGVCSNPNKSNDASCNDGDACTQTDTCQSGVCVGFNPVVCADPDACHQAGTCNPGTGTCDYIANPDGTLCGANNPCSHDICQTGACAANTPKPQGTACNDSNTCTQTDACDGSGNCVGGDPVICLAPDVCHAQGTCDPSSGSCAHDLLANWCFIGGACYAANSVNPDNPCQACRPALSVSAFSNVDDASSCDDGDACTQTDTCQAGVCVGANPVVCAALDQCHAPGTCDPATGQCSNPDKPNGSSCNDGDACTQTDSCQSGVCVGSNAVVCTPLDQCHVAGTCNPSTGQCSNPARSDGASCDDGNACTTNDQCYSGVCQGTPAACTAQDQCHTAGTCNPATGQCSNPAKQDGTACDDGNACTTNDTCQGGACVGGSVGTCNQCGTCAVGHACASASDCNSRICNSGICACLSSFANCGSIYGQPNCAISCCSGSWFGASSAGQCQ